ncbi:RICIN domain-containing protein [Streptomyces achromogenes]|uniref:RICIN domain-containing protein n=1 Tax=Streptomyces achromogenes TaxID=67255 RepID=UPI003425D292
MNSGSRLRLLYLGLVAIVVLSLGASPASARSDAVPSEDGWVTLGQAMTLAQEDGAAADSKWRIGVLTNDGGNPRKCVDADPGTPYNGGRVYLYDCQAGNSNQTWTFRTSGSGLFAFIHKDSDGRERALEAWLGDPGNGQSVLRYDWYGWLHTPQNQMWFWPSDDHTHYANARFGHHCLEGDPNTANLQIQRLQLWECNGAPWQKFVFLQV